MHKNVPVAKRYIKNSFELIDKLSGVRIDDYLDLISLNSMFTNIPTYLALQNIKERWKYIKS